MKSHPLACLFPLINGAELKALASDIATNGLREPIAVFDGQVLDGRNRLAACKLAKVEPRFEIVPKDTHPLKFVLSRNLRRRHLNPSQRAMLGASLENGKWGRQSKDANLHLKKLTRAEAAKECLVSVRSIADAKAILERAPDLVKAVESGAKTINEALRAIKETERENKRRSNASKIAQSKELPLDVVFSTIMIDPPWDWGDEGDVDQLGRAKPDYATMSLEEIKALPVGTLSDEHCHLYLWITNRSLPKGFDLIEAWGFRYVTMITWAKPSFGMGNYFRGQTEHILFGIKGSQPLKRKDASTLFIARRGKGGHSSKPVAFYDFVESCSPGPYLEMFSRSSHKGWSQWGENS